MKIQNKEVAQNSTFGGYKESGSNRAFTFKNDAINFSDIEFQYSGRNNTNFLSRLIKNDFDKQKKAGAKSFSSSLLEQKINKKLGNPQILRDLRNPLKRIKMPPGSDELLIGQYFDKWSRVHTVYCHYAIAADDTNAMVYHVIFDESGQYILSASVDGLIKIFNKNFQLVHTIRGHTRDISILAMSSNNKYVVSVDEGGICRLWDFPTGK